MLAGVSEILIISTPRHISSFRELLGDGSQWGLNLRYAVQPYSGGLADAFMIGEPLISVDLVSLVLGCNIFYGSEHVQQLTRAFKKRIGATIFAYHVNDTERYGVVTFDATRQAVNLEVNQRGRRLLMP